MTQYFLTRHTVCKIFENTEAKHEYRFDFDNGDIVDRKEGLIEYCDRGHQFGDGVFEIVPVYNGKVLA